jgi:hypothetical protein
VEDLLQGLCEMYNWLHTAVFMRSMWNIKIFNPIKALGFVDEKVSLDLLMDWCIHLRRHTTYWPPR